MGPDDASPTAPSGQSLWTGRSPSSSPTNETSSPRKCSIRAALGPSIGPCCFEVGDEVVVLMNFQHRERDHYRIPEGTFYITRKNPDSQYYRAFVVSYPNGEHAARGLRDGLISQAQHDAIVRAEQTFSSPPMGTRLGGLIEIHGQGSGRQHAWTRGCVALRNVHMDDLRDLVHVGTPVVIER